MELSSVVSGVQTMPMALFLGSNAMYIKYYFAYKMVETHG